MAATIQIKLEGMTELVQAMRRMPVEVRGQALEKAAISGAEVIAQAAAAAASGAFTSRTGKLMGVIQNLKKMVRVLVRSPEYVLVQIWPHRVPYAHLIEGGHRLVARGSRRRRAGGGERTLGVVAARPFVGPAYEATKEQAAQKVLDELWKSVENVWTGGK
jgi:hypothetical protein